MIAFLIFLSTLYGVPHQVLLLPVILLLVKNRNRAIVLNKQQVRIIVIISVIVLVSFINSLIHITQITGILNLFPYTSLMLASFIVAYYIEEKDIELLVKFILIESAVVIVEYFLGINTILFWSEDFKKFGSFSILYNSRPFGLSANSSIIAVKIFLSILLIDYFELFKNKRQIFFWIFLGAIILTFPRTILVVIVAYYFLKYISAIKLTLKVKQRLLIISLAMILLSSIIAVLGAKKIEDKLYSQFTRGGKKIELSGRPQIWAQYMDFIKSHKFFGNYSQKLEIEVFKGKGKQHAHNSFIQILANHGLIIAVLFIILLICNIDRNNYIYVFVLVIYSLFQYGIFWGISITDIILFLFIQGKPKLDMDIP